MLAFGKCSFVGSSTVGSLVSGSSYIVHPTWAPVSRASHKYFAESKYLNLMAITEGGSFIGRLVICTPSPYRITKVSTTKLNLCIVTHDV